MATFAQKMNLANFTCRFGEKFVMLDLFEEVVYPAFTKPYRRTYADAEYFLFDVALIKPANNELALIGRIVKNTTVSRDQVFKDGKIVPDRHAIASAPTSFFVLTLSNHKLLYVRENSGAPFLSTFASTISLFLGKAYREWVQIVYDQEKKRKPATTWKEITEDFPRPHLEITPMATESSVTAYVEKFRVINTVEVRLLATNHELDNSPIFGDMRKVKDKIGADEILLKTQKTGEVGLDKGSVAHLIATQAEEGNAKISIRGTDITGNKVKAENDSFNVAIPVKTLPQDAMAASARLLQKLQDQVRTGFILLKDAPKEVHAKIRAIIDGMTWE